MVYSHFKAVWIQCRFKTVLWFNFRLILLGISCLKPDISSETVMTFPNGTSQVINLWKLQLHCQLLILSHSLGHLCCVQVIIISIHVSKYIFFISKWYRFFINLKKSYWAKCNWKIKLKIHYPHTDERQFGNEIQFYF